MNRSMKDFGHKQVSIVPNSAVVSKRGSLAMNDWLEKNKN